MLSALLLILAFICEGFSVEFHEQPQTQHVLDRTSAYFTCRANGQNVYWDIQFQNQTHLPIMRRNLNQYMEDGISANISTNDNVQQILTLRIVARPSYNNTRVWCKVHDGRGETSSDSPAKLLVYQSLRPLSPSMIKIRAINTTALLIQWTPSFLWDGYTINHYNLSVHRVDSSSLLPPMNSSGLQLIYVLAASLALPSCAQLNFSITAINTDYGSSDPISVIRGFDAIPGKISEHSITTNVFFRSNGTPLADLKFQLPDTACSYQELNYTITVHEDDDPTTVITSLGPYMTTGPANVSHSITSGLILDHKYSVKVTVTSAVGNSLTNVYFNTSLDPELYPTIPPCKKLSANGQNSQLFTYKVAMGVCLGVAVAMLFTLVFVLLCVLIYRQWKRYQEKALNVSTNRMQNAMVHNPIYDGPVYDSIQPHFDTLVASTKQDLSLSHNTSASNSPGSSTPPNAGNNSNSQKTVRYLDQPLQLRSQSLSHPRTPDNNDARSTSVCAPANARVMALKKNGKERNKLHLTLTLNGNEFENPTDDATCSKQNDATVLVGDLPGNDVTISDGDENYSVMSPIKGKGGGSRVIELSPEDTDKYKEEIN